MENFDPVKLNIESLKVSIESLKVGFYVDHENIRLGGGNDIDYDVLLKFFSEGSYVLRSIAYVVTDPEQTDDVKDKLHRYRDKLRHIGYKVVEKELRRYRDPRSNDVVVKGGVATDIVIDVLRQAEGLEVVVLCSGDGELVRLVETVQMMGKRVIIVVPEKSSRELRDAADEVVNLKDIHGIRRFNDSDS